MSFQAPSSNKCEPQPAALERVALTERQGTSQAAAPAGVSAERLAVATKAVRTNVAKPASQPPVARAHASGGSQRTMSPQDPAVSTVAHGARPKLPASGSAPRPPLCAPSSSRPAGLSIKVPNKVPPSTVKATASTSPPVTSSVQNRAAEQTGRSKHVDKGVRANIKAEAVAPNREHTMRASGKVNLFKGGDLSTARAEALGAIMTPEQLEQTTTFLNNAVAYDPCRLEELLKQKELLSPACKNMASILDSDIADEKAKSKQEKKRKRSVSQHVLYTQIAGIFDGLSDKTFA